VVTGTQSGAGALNCSYLICGGGAAGGGRKLREREGAREVSPKEGKRKQAGHPQGGTREGTGWGNRKRGNEGRRNERSKEGEVLREKQGAEWLWGAEGLPASNAKHCRGVLSGHSRAEQLSWSPPGSQDDEEAV